MTNSCGQMLDALVTAVLKLDDNLNIVHINAAGEDLLQTSAAQAIGTPLQGLVVRANRIIESLHHALAVGQPFTEREATIRLPDNLTHEVDLTASIIDDEQRGRALVLEMQPLNRLRRINKDEESVARQETSRQLIRGLAHEIKNPLGGIRGAAQLLERQLPDSDLREYTAVIISEADRLKNLVDRMLGPQRELSLGQVNILKVCEHVIALIEAERPGFIHWQRDYDPSLPDLQADEAQLIQAVLNIVRNACDAVAGSDEPRIGLRSRGVRQFTIGTTRHRLVLELDITDNGSGIDPQLEERIFFPMISGRPDGTGLGLAITQNIIAQHKGSIQAHSRAGQTTFTVYLPFVLSHTDTTDSATITANGGGNDE